MPAWRFAQSLGKHWEWVPWKRILSEDASMEIRAKKSQSSQHDLLQVMASSLGVLREEREAEVVVGLGTVCLGTLHWMTSLQLWSPNPCSCLVLTCLSRSHPTGLLLFCVIEPDLLGV